MKPLFVHGCESPCMSKGFSIYKYMEYKEKILDILRSELRRNLLLGGVYDTDLVNASNEIEELFKELEKDNKRQKVVIKQLQKDLIQEWEKQNESDYTKYLESMVAFMCKVYQDNFDRSRKQSLDIGSFSTVQGFELRRLVKELSKLRIRFKSKVKPFFYLETLIAKYKDYEK